MPTNILITGALGHIGSKLIRNINDIEHGSVVLLDNLSSQRYPSLFNLSDSIEYDFVEADIRSIDFSSILETIDVVIHLAAITDASSSFDHQEEVEQVNYEGTEKLARACADFDVKLFFPSTTSVYGSQSELVDETCSVRDLKPQSPYAESKLKSELLLKELGASNGLKYVICRFGTIFGSSIGMRFHTAVNKFCWQAVTGQPLTVWKTALDQRRPYLGISDAVEAIKFIITRQLFDGEIYNVVTSNKTVRDIIDSIKTEITHVEIELVDSEIMNQLSYAVSANKIGKKGLVMQSDLSCEIKQTLRMLNNGRSQPLSEHK